MKPKRAVHRQLETITRTVARRRLRDKVFLLEGELVRGLERASAAQERSRDLEGELRRFKARATDEIRGLRERNAVQAQRFLVTLRELAETRAEARAERSGHRLEVVLLRTRCQQLAAMCRALALAIGRARGSGLDAQAPKQIPPHLQGSS